MNTNFYSLWFDSIGNRIRVYCLGSKSCSIHLNTDRFALVIQPIILRSSLLCHRYLCAISEFFTLRL